MRSTNSHELTRSKTKRWSILDHVLSSSLHNLLYQLHKLGNIILSSVKRSHQSDLINLFVPDVEEILFLEHRNIFSWYGCKHSVSFIELRKFDFWNFLKPRRKNSGHSIRASCAAFPKIAG